MIDLPDKYKPEILIVDDIESNLYALKSLISSHFDASITEASSGEEVLRIINERPADLILMDVMMPGMDGFETARLIRNRPKTSGIPVIFISAHDPTRQLYEKGVASGGFDYLTKPIDDQQLIYRLGMYLRFIRHEHEMNRHLRELNEQLALSIAAKDKFFSILAHDLRNPFHAIIGMTELMLEASDGFTAEERSDFIRSIHKTGQSTYQLLQNLLEWARTQTGRIKAEPETLEVYAVAFEVKNSLLSQAAVKGVSLEADIEGGLKVFADKNMLQTILRNLVQNAIKYSYPGGLIRMGATPVEGATEICIQDNGKGMEKETLRKLFRIDAAVSEKGTSGESGTGLGLVICHEFVTLNRGSIMVHSNPGEGTRFTVKLPATAQDW